MFIEGLFIEVKNKKYDILTFKKIVGVCSRNCEIFSTNTPNKDFKDISCSSSANWENVLGILLFYFSMLE